MEFTTTYITPEIKLSRYSDRLFKTDVSFEHHSLIWFISGEVRVIQANGSHVFGAGDIFLIPRNQLTTVICNPADGLPHQSVAMHLSAARLRDYYAGLDVKPQAPGTTGVYVFSSHPLLRSCMASLIPYFDLQDPFPERIADLKLHEAISVLRLSDPAIDSVLANFDEPGKLDLPGFMETHFMFNMPLEKFGYLTGRSLSTFNRDFKKHYSTTPQRWLTARRLALAHYQISGQRRKPAEVYLEAGFEDLSHFSHAFKRQYGYPPSALLAQPG